jgi:hypothetical protein
LLKVDTFVDDWLPNIAGTLDARFSALIAEIVRRIATGEFVDVEGDPLAPAQSFIAGKRALIAEYATELHVLLTRALVAWQCSQGGFTVKKWCHYRRSKDKRRCSSHTLFQSPVFLF